VGPGYFDTLGIPLLRGRQIDATDAARGARVCVVNEEFAKRYFPDSDPIGKHVTDEYPTTRETYEMRGRGGRRTGTPAVNHSARILVRRTRWLRGGPLILRLSAGDVNWNRAFIRGPKQTGPPCR
jgi:hypothetical protein